MAVKGGSIEVIQALLDYGANPSACDVSSKTPLHMAISEMNCEIPSLLLQHGSNIHAKGSNGETPLHLAVEYADSEDDIDVVTLLLEHGASVSAKGDKHETPLHIAAKRGLKDILRRLLEYVKNSMDVINVQRLDGCSALHLAIANGASGDVVTLLLEHGASVSAIDSDGETALHIAAEKGTDEDMHQLLTYVKQTPILNIGRHQDGLTALHLAIERRQIGKVRMLYQSGADFSVRSHDGNSALDIALLSVNKEIESIGHEVRRRMWTANIAEDAVALSTGMPWYPATLPSTSGH